MALSDKRCQSPSDGTTRNFVLSFSLYSKNKIRMKHKISHQGIKLFYLSVFPYLNDNVLNIHMCNKRERESQD